MRNWCRKKYQETLEMCLGEMVEPAVRDISGTPSPSLPGFKTNLGKGQKSEQTLNVKCGLC